ncbi:MAG TPA: LytTR family DNA-binding domain-containing protein [Bacillota bacterium]|nr:LytTR family DNA-binding domain-containing protein [Bacillota bacterium]
MEVEIKIDEAYKTPKLVIFTNEVTQEISDLINKLSNNTHKTLVGFKDDEVFILKNEDIISFYAEDQKVLARCTQGIFRIKSRLYELEETFSGTSFVRISNSEIVNFDKVASLDLSISGAISLKLKNGDKTFVSRRYVEKIKNYIGL